MLKKRRLTWHHLLPGISLVFTLFVFAPADLYLSYSDELWFSFISLVRWLCIFGGATFLIVTALAVLLPPKLSVAFRAVVYACSFMAWLQGNLLVLNYGSLDGQLINWNAYTGSYILHALLWLAVIGLFVFLMFRFRKKFRTILEIAACVLIVTQIASIGVFLVQHRQNHQTEEGLYLSQEGQFTVSPEENTIVFVVDTVDSLFFDELVKKYPDVMERDFADFTYYRDTVGGACRTKYAVPYILTGDVNRIERPYSEYIADVYANTPLMQELATGKYDTGFYTNPRFIDLNRSDAVGNIASGAIIPASRFRLTKMFMKLVAFRYAPSFFSRYFWIYTGDFEDMKLQAGAGSAYSIDDAAFYTNMKSKGLKATAEKPVFRFLHLRGVHLPYTLDENAKRVGYGNTDETRQCLGVLKIVSDYMDRMKKLGVYDNATILVIADHGSYDHSSVAQSPLFMIKLSGQSHPFKISELPMHFSSIPQMLLSALHGTLTAVEPYEASSPRYFYKRSENTSTVNLTEYRIDGPVWEAPAVATGVVYHEGTLSNSRAYTLGTTLYFDDRDTARSYFVSGIAHNEGVDVWTVGRDAEMLFELSEVPGALQLNLEHGTYDGKQTVEVWVNDQLVDTYSGSGHTRHTVLIPEGTVTGTEFRLRLHLPDAHSPASKKKGTDTRLLGLSMKSVLIQNAGQ